MKVISSHNFLKLFEKLNFLDDCVKLSLKTEFIYVKIPNLQ
jgi:hypothetical protein